MTDMATLRAQAAAARRGDAGSTPMPVPRDRPERPEVRFGSQLRANRVVRDEMEWYQVEGYASVFERGYEMWDWYGPYTEIVSAGAAAQTLASDPEVVFRFNHAGTPMASTRNGRLELWVDDTGLGQRAWLNPKRADVALLVQAIEDADVREQSFMFRITEGQWSPDYSEYRITEFDLERGDVGPVTYGANPHTSVSARSGEFLAALDQLPPLAAREAYSRLAQRSDVASLATSGVVRQPAARLGGEPGPELLNLPTPARQGRSIGLLRTQLLIDRDED